MCYMEFLINLFKIFTLKVKFLLVKKYSSFSIFLTIKNTVKFAKIN